MRICEHCGGEVAEAIAKCPHCLSWSEEVLIELLRHPEAVVRKQAACDAVFLARPERIIRVLAVTLGDPVAAVRQHAAVALFIRGRKAENAIPELIDALGDSDLKVRRVAAASLSMIGPPAKTALPTLAQLRNAEDELLRAFVAEAERSIAGQ